MSKFFTLNGKDSTISVSFFPPIQLEGKTDYYLGLTDFECFNSVPNIDEDNCLLHYANNKTIEIPTGSYEIEDIQKVLQEKLGADGITLEGNNNTLKSEITSKYRIDFTKERTIGRLLGFSSRVLEPGKKHVSDQMVDITRLNAIVIECNLVSDAYINSSEIHVIYSFALTTAPGYKIIEVPSTIIYLPVKRKIIDNITIRVLDQDGKLLNLRGESITVRLHLKNGLSI